MLNTDALAALISIGNNDQLADVNEQPSEHAQSTPPPLNRQRDNQDDADGRRADSVQENDAPQARVRLEFGRVFAR